MSSSKWQQFSVSLNVLSSHITDNKQGFSQKFIRSLHFVGSNRFIRAFNKSDAFLQPSVISTLHEDRVPACEIYWYQILVKWVAGDEHFD